MTTELLIPAPAPRAYTRRITPELASMPVDHMRPIRVDFPTEKTFRIYAKRRGWKLATKKDGDMVLIWRIA